MNETVWKRDEVDSPCVNICVVHPDGGICIGCKRTLAEISNWSKMPADDRARIIAELPDRPVAAKGRKGGRAARIAR